MDTEAGQFSFFALGLVKPLQDLKVDDNGDPLRKRQQHRKSRNGCVNCKKRKVKCDEGQPCSSCKKRGLECKVPIKGKASKSPKTLAQSETFDEKSSEIDFSVSSTPDASDTVLQLPLSSIQPQELPMVDAVLPLLSAQPQELFLPFELADELLPLSPWTASEQSLSSWPTSISTFPFPFTYDPSYLIGSAQELYLDSPKEPSLSITNVNTTTRSNPPSTISSNFELLLRRSLAERELIQHFEDVTSKNLTMSTTIWRNQVLYAAMHRDYLMSAVMLMSAAHINHFLPRNDPRRRPLLHHFGNAISGLRVAIESELNLENLDDIISSSLLLMQYSWTNMDTSPLDSLNIADMFCDSVTLFNGLKSCVFASSGLFHYINSAWSNVFGYSPRVSLEDYNHIHKTRDRPFFKKYHHLTLCGLGTRDPACCSSDNMNGLQRLGIVLSAIEVAGHDLEVSGIANDVYRYLMTWPPFCTSGFLQQVKDNNPASLCILLYYFAAIVRVSCDRIWWMRDRALYMYTLLRQRLEGRCESCTGPAIELVGNLDQRHAPSNGRSMTMEE